MEPQHCANNIKPFLMDLKALLASGCFCFIYLAYSLLSKISIEPLIGNGFRKAEKGELYAFKPFPSLSDFKNGKYGQKVGKENLRTTKLACVAGCIP